MIYPYQLNVHHSAFCWLESLGDDFYGWHLSCLGATNSWSCLFVFIAFLLLERCKEVLPNRACQDTVFCVSGQYGMISFLRNTNSRQGLWCSFSSKRFTLRWYTVCNILGPSQYKEGLSRYGYFHYKDKMVMKPSYLDNGNSCTGKTWSLYWDGPLVFLSSMKPCCILEKIYSHWQGVPY